jgi:hypothetical protein
LSRPKRVSVDAYLFENVASNTLERLGPRHSIRVDVGVEERRERVDVILISAVIRQMGSQLLME